MVLNPMQEILFKIYCQYGFDPNYFKESYNLYIDSHWVNDWFGRKGKKFLHTRTFRHFLESEYFHGF